MTTVLPSVQTCGVCQQRSTQRILGSTSAFGSHDLDLRPPPLQRHTMEYWQQECPGCGYVNTDLDELLPGAVGVVRSTEFAALRAAVHEPALVNRFKRHALLQADDAVKAGWSILHAAWVYDDLNRPERARRCREECADFWSTLEYGADEPSARMRTVMVDVLRRAEHFEEAEALIEVILATGGATDHMRRALAFQRTLIAAGDTAGYTLEQALEKAPNLDERTTVGDRRPFWNFLG